MVIQDYRIKQMPSDFCVEEVPGYVIKADGEFLVYKMSKESTTTFDAINMIINTLHIPPKDIGYAGLKDKNARTVQYITFKKSMMRKYEQTYVVGNIRLELAGYRDEKLYPGCLEGNRFSIVIRKIDILPKKIEQMINLFGDQRFSSNNIEIGRRLLKRDFEGAIKLISETDELSKDALNNSKNYINILQKMNQKVLSLYAHAFQSYVWNCTARRIVEMSKVNAIDGIYEITIPLIGYDMSADGQVKYAIDEVLNEEKIKLRDLIVRELPRISLEGGDRKLFVQITGLKISELSDDELNEGMQKCTVEFTLPKGSYGTECVRQMLD